MTWGRTVLVAATAALLAVLHPASCAAAGLQRDPRDASADLTNLVARAKSGDGDAYFRLGVMLLSGRGVPRNRYLAWDYLNEAHGRGHGYASLLLGLACEYHGEFVSKGVRAWGDDLPFRDMLSSSHCEAPRGPYFEAAVYAAPSETSPAQAFYESALSNGVAGARACLDRVRTASEDLRRRNLERRESWRRITSGDCRNEEERRAFEERRARMEEERARNLESERRMGRAELGELLAEVGKVRKARWRRLAEARAGGDPAELYWSACFLRAAAATASDRTPGRRVDLARRSLGCLEMSAEMGHAPAEFALGAMLVGGSLDVLGPDPAGRGGCVRFRRSDGRDWTATVPRHIDFVADHDIKGPAFAPLVRVRRISEAGATNVESVLVYERDARRGVALLRRAAERGHAEARRWFSDRGKAGLPEDAPPWELARDGFSVPTSNPVLAFRRYDRETDFLGRIHREIRVDRFTGALVAVGDETSERKACSPWNAEEEPPPAGMSAVDVAVEMILEDGLESIPVGRRLDELTSRADELWGHLGPIATNDVERVLYASARLQAIVECELAVFAPRAREPGQDHVAKYVEQLARFSERHPRGLESPALRELFGTLDEKRRPYVKGHVYSILRRRPGW